MTTAHLSCLTLSLLTKSLQKKKTGQHETSENTPGLKAHWARSGFWVQEDRTVQIALIKDAMEPLQKWPCDCDSQRFISSGCFLREANTKIKRYQKLTALHVGQAVISYLAAAPTTGKGRASGSLPRKMVNATQYKSDPSWSGLGKSDGTGLSTRKFTGRREWMKTGEESWREGPHLPTFQGLVFAFFVGLGLLGSPGITPSHQQQSIYSQPERAPSPPRF